MWQLEWKKVESLLIISSLSRIYFLEENQWVSDCWGGREHFCTTETELCIWDMPHWYYPSVSCAGFWLPGPFFHLILVEAISLPVQHLKNQFWISTQCFNPLWTSNGALLPWKTGNMRRFWITEICKNYTSGQPKLIPEQEVSLFPPMELTAGLSRLLLMR